ncbi:glutaredoxin 3 [Paremcibacter congregatus]|uniref:Glutaredoxin n=1 Tax=Paremcibacter congregatus TaxID=2043170 RepID=A0A2G4YPT7_9PROT|nr:glutaredoxin 3 [Paremcibacter congregatus]PHZ84305.1 glutaredoxin 3 [Paremcibacter congregatus]QDE29343.1 glutaredoxin 3 [Paremcibacter congregatus]
MSKVTIYTKMMCPYCVDAKLLLTEKGQAFDEIDIGRNPDQRPVMIDRASGGHTVPQIFIGDTHVGGCDELYALERAGKLDAMLA